MPDIGGGGGGGAINGDKGGSISEIGGGGGTLGFGSSSLFLASTSSGVLVLAEPSYFSWSSPDKCSLSCSGEDIFPDTSV
jgi:hypothetical protein